ncbi:MAG TPA: alcohol dehydrogenase [Lentisphaeria bacterium]|nr:alcohol dehydrogenase [Lentisphaeria bacterium]|tara:strand:+ start:8331 stop:9998 length:1668 start_codon:yes stop_codon:yes gene_type:complete
MAIPATQYAVQLVGPDELTLNTSKPVLHPGPHQILAKIECVGLCFSDLKLLNQFSGHARKSEIVGGLAKEILDEIPSYVPNDEPTVPGHEVVCRIIEIGDQVKHHEIGERCLIQADFRQLPTAGSNAAFGYNFEGALQEYVLLDERVVIDHDGERFLIPVAEHLGASQAALVEPWACVEDSYVVVERATVLPGGRLLIVAAAGHEIQGVEASYGNAPPATITAITDESQHDSVSALGNVTFTDSVADVANEGFDDIIYFGSSKADLDALNDKLAVRGIINIVLGGETIGELVHVGVGRVHYGFTRWVGTTASDASEGYKRVPEHPEVRDGDSVVVIGAGGPMGQMHVIRNICSGRSDLSVTATDLDDTRLRALARKCEAIAAANNVTFRMVNTKSEQLDNTFSYWALMAPISVLVEQAIAGSKPNALINIFAGIPAPVKHDLDLDTYIGNGLYMFGTSGSTISDMKIVLQKVTDGQLNTNTSVDAISGMAGATGGIDAVKNRTMAGKIIVYPQLHDIGLIPLSQLAEHFPTVAAKLHDGQWCSEAEAELLKTASA